MQLLASCNHNKGIHLLADNAVVSHNYFNYTVARQLKTRWQLKGWLMLCMYGSYEWSYS